VKKRPRKPKGVSLSTVREVERIIRLGRLIFFSVPMVQSHLAAKAMKGKGAA
jgi:hypothetical protein